MDEFPRPMTKAELYRRLRPGVKLILTQWLGSKTGGNLTETRTIETSKLNAYTLRTQRNSISHLNIQPNEYIVETKTGFEVWLKAEGATPGQPAHDARLMVAYIWVDLNPPITLNLHSDEPTTFAEMMRRDKDS